MLLGNRRQMQSALLQEQYVFWRNLNGLLEGIQGMPLGLLIELVKRKDGAGENWIDLARDILKPPEGASKENGPIRGQKRC